MDPLEPVDSLGASEASETSAACALFAGAFFSDPSCADSFSAAFALALLLATFSASFALDFLACAFLAGALFAVVFLAGAFFAAVFFADVDSLDALEAYQVHPAHKEVGAYIKSVVESRVAVDFEL